MDIEDLDDLEYRIAKLEKNSWLWDIAGFFAIIVMIAGVIDLAKQIWHLIFH
jgi:hypothetical protein